MRLAGKSALIVGGTSGIGLATARLMLDEGARVAICGQDNNRLAAAASTLHDRTFACQADIRRLFDIKQLADRIGRWSSPLDILFINAGISRPAPVENVDEAFFEEHMATNVRGPFFVLQEMLPLLKRGASVVITTSCLDRMGRPGMSVYAASKAALRSMVRTFGAELVGRGIRVNAVAPGPIDSGIHAKMGVSGDALLALQERIAHDIPMQRLGLPEDVAEAVLFLTSDGSSFVTGHELLVDGGWSSF